MTDACTPGQPEQRGREEPFLVSAKCGACGTPYYVEDGHRCESVSRPCTCVMGERPTSASLATCPAHSDLAASPAGADPDAMAKVSADVQIMNSAGYGLAPAEEGARAGRRILDAVAALTAQLAEARADVVAAASDLPVPLPEPGTAMARVLIANRVLKRALAAAQSELAQLAQRAEQAREAAERELGTYGGHTNECSRALLGKCDCGWAEISLRAGTPHG